MNKPKIHNVLIHRMWTTALIDYFRMKDIKNAKIIRMRRKNDHEVLEPYEKLFNKKLGRMDAIVVSPLTESEIREIMDNYDTNAELHAYKQSKNEERLKYYEENYGHLPE